MKINLTLNHWLALFAALVCTSLVNAQQEQISERLEGLSAKIPSIDTATLKTTLARTPELVLIDVRTSAEIITSGGTIGVQQNINIPRGWLEMRIAAAVAEKHTPIVVYCGTNQRSILAAQTLLNLGYSNVQNYPEGFFGWRDAGLRISSPDRAPESMLYSLPRQVSERVWSAIGATAPSTYENSGHNNNLSFIIGDHGVVVVNAGDNYLLAKALHQEITAITQLPVKFVVLENGQGHAMLGANYWQEQGAAIVAHEDTAHEMEAYGAQVLERMRAGRRDKSLGTTLTKPDQTFTDHLLLDVGGQPIELRNLGPAHSPGDIVVWLPDEKLVISGDLAFHERLLPVFEHTDTRAWVSTWQAFEQLGAAVVIPGHGGPTTVSEVTRYTRDYLQHMHAEIGKLIEDGGDLNDAYEVDQSAYRHLDTFNELAAQNAGRIYRALEFDF